MYTHYCTRCKRILKQKESEWNDFSSWGRKCPYCGTKEKMYASEDEDIIQNYCQGSENEPNIEKCKKCPDRFRCYTR